MTFMEHFCADDSVTAKYFEEPTASISINFVPNSFNETPNQAMLRVCEHIFKTHTDLYLDGDPDTYDEICRAWTEQLGKICGTFIEVMLGGEQVHYKMLEPFLAMPNEYFDNNEVVLAFTKVIEHAKACYVKEWDLDTTEHVKLLDDIDKMTYDEFDAWLDKKFPTEDVDSQIIPNIEDSSTWRGNTDSNPF